MNGSGIHSSLLRYGGNYGRKKFYSTGSRIQIRRFLWKTYKHFVTLLLPLGAGLYTQMLDLAKNSGQGRETIGYFAIAWRPNVNVLWDEKSRRQQLPGVKVTKLVLLVTDEEVKYARAFVVASLFKCDNICWEDPESLHQGGNWKLFHSGKLGLYSQILDFGGEGCKGQTL